MLKLQDSTHLLHGKQQRYNLCNYSYHEPSSSNQVQLINQWQPEADTGSRNIVGHVTEEGRTSYIIYCTNNEEITLQRSSIPSTSDYYPRNGDWVMLGIVEQLGGSDKEGESSRIEITDVKPLRRKEVTATIEYYTGELCNFKNIIFL